MPDGDSRGRVFVCPVCEREFRTLNGLTYHLRKHLVNNVCPICGYQARKYNGLAQHIRHMARHDEKHLVLSMVFNKNGKSRRAARNYLLYTTTPAFKKTALP